MLREGPALIIIAILFAGVFMNIMKLHRKALYSALGLVLIGLCVLVNGCGYVDEALERVYIEPHPWTSQLPENYRMVTVGQSTSADVLEVINRPEKELLFQDESVIASLGRRKEGSQLWLALVGFEEDSLVAMRKYFFATDEKSWHINAEDQKMLFETVMIVPYEVLNDNYANEDTRRVAIVNYIKDSFKEDSFGLIEQSQDLHSIRMMVNQTFNGIGYKLDRSPALAQKLPKEDGLEFDHMNYGKGKVRMLIRDDIVVLQLKIGYKPWGFEWNLDVSELDDRSYGPEKDIQETQ